MSKLERILLIDDEPDIQLVVRIALENVGGFTVRVCPEGEAAVVSALEFRPHLILLDVMMPGMDGPSVLHLLQSTRALAGIPVVFMTAKIQTDEVDHLLRSGAVEVIAKPFDPMTLAARVRDIWQRHGY